MVFNYRLIILLLLLSSNVMGQSLAPSGNYNTLNVFNGGTKSTRAMIAPKGFQPWATYDTTGFIWLDTVNHFLYYHNGISRVQVGAGGGGSGTVTNVSTGFGMLGGPITTTGTVRVDSNAVLTVARGYKIADSGLSTRVPYTGATQTLNLGTQNIITDTITGTGSGGLHLHGSASNSGIEIANFGQVRMDYYPIVNSGDSVLTTNAQGFIQVYNLKGNYVPYTGAISNTNTGEYGIKAGQYDLDLTPTGTYTTGTTYWDATHLATATYLNSSVTNVNGQTFYMRGRNNTGTTIAKGKAVYVNDAQGNNPTISLADADSVTTSQVIGITAESIADNGTGYVMVSGYLDGVNTSAYADGDALYLDTTNGNLTNQLLPSPHNVVFVAYALNSTNNGRYFIRPSSPIASDTTMTAGSNQIAPTQAAVKKYVQSRGYGTGTVTSVGSGFGLSGGTITTTGTLRVDSTNVPTQYRVDTTAFNALTRINTKGTVTSVAVANGFGLTVSGSPVTGTGTITATVDTTLVATIADVNAATRDTVALSNRISLLNTLQGASIASADTINLLTTTGNIVDVTGTTTIRGLSPSASANSALIGARRVIRFTGALTLTYNATTNILPGSANITTVNGDMAEFIYLGGVSWVCMNYTTRTVTGTGASVKAASPSITGTLTTAAITASGTISMTGGTVTLGSSTGASTVGLGTGATTTGNTKTINIGGAAASGSTQNINIGSTAAAGSTQGIVIGSTAATSTTTLNGTVTVANVSTVSGTVVSNTGTQTLTNKRITYRNVTAANYTTSVTIASDDVDMVVITAQAGALLFNAPSGTPTEGQMLLIRIKDNGTARALTWNSVFRSGTDVTLPTTTTISKTLYMEFLYNTTDTKWDIVGKADGY